MVAAFVSRFVQIAVLAWRRAVLKFAMKNVWNAVIVGPSVPRGQSP